MRWTRAAVVGLGFAAACSSFGSDEEAPGAGVDGGAGADVAADAGALLDGGSETPDACAAGTDFASDPHHCGVCGHDCLGGSCSAGVCGAFRVALASTNVGGLAVMKSGVYWFDALNGNLIRTCVPEGCSDGSPSLLTTLPQPATEIAAFGEQLAVATHDKVLTVTSGGAATPFDQNTGKALVTVGDNAFAFIAYPGGQASVFYYEVGGSVIAVPVGGTQVTLAVPSHPLHDHELFAYSPGSPESISTCDLHSPAACNPKPLLGAGDTRNGQNKTILAATSDTVFWLQPDESRLEKCASKGCFAPTNLKTLPSMSSLAVDEQFVYFTTSNPGTVERCTHDDCAAQHVLLAKGQPSPHALVVTANAVYWATDGVDAVDGVGAIPPAIWRLAR